MKHCFLVLVGGRSPVSGLSVDRMLTSVIVAYMVVP